MISLEDGLYSLKIALLFKKSLAKSKNKSLNVRY